MNELTQLLSNNKNNHINIFERSSLRSKIWHVLHYCPSKTNPRLNSWDHFSYFFEIFILNLIVANVILTLYASADRIDPAIHLGKELWYTVSLIFSTIIFSIEYLLRLWSCVEDRRYGSRLGRIKWILHPMSLIDLIALVPYLLEINFLYVEDLQHSQLRGASSIRSLRLLRIISFLRLERSYNAIRKVRLVFAKKREELLVVSYITMVTVLIASTTIFFLEHNRQPDVFSSVAAGAWWAIETITSLGYGDTIPVTIAGRIFGSIVALLGIVLFSIPGAILGSGFLEVMLEDRKTKNMTRRKSLELNSYKLRDVSNSISCDDRKTNEKIDELLKYNNLHVNCSDQLVHSKASKKRKVFQETSEDHSAIIEKLDTLLINQQQIEMQIRSIKGQIETVLLCLGQNSS